MASSSPSLAPPRSQLGALAAAVDRARAIGDAVRGQLGDVDFFSACTGWETREEAEAVMRNTILVTPTGDAWVAHSDDVEEEEGGAIVPIVRGAGSPRADADVPWVRSISYIMPAALATFSQGSAQARHSRITPSRPGWFGRATTSRG